MAFLDSVQSLTKFSIFPQEWKKSKAYGTRKDVK